MKGAIITLGVLGYLTGTFLTFGVLFNEREQRCATPLSNGCVIWQSAIGGVVWPLLWGGRLGIEATRPRA